MYRVLSLTSLGKANILKSKVNEYTKYLLFKGLNMGASFYSYHVSQRSNSSNPFSDAIHWGNLLIFDRMRLFNRRLKKNSLRNVKEKLNK